MFAVIQYGYNICGVGEDEDSALEMAAEYCDLPDNIKTMPMTDGDIIIVGATKELCDHVIKCGGDVKYTISGGVADICLTPE